MPKDQVIAVALGLAFGAVVALAIFLAELAVRRWVDASALLDVLLRLGVFGAIALGTAEFIGTFFAPLVRAHVLGFWCSFAVGLVLPPWVVQLHLRRAQRKNAG